MCLYTCRTLSHMHSLTREGLPAGACAAGSAGRMQPQSMRADEEVLMLQGGVRVREVEGIRNSQFPL